MENDRAIISNHIETKGQVISGCRAKMYDALQILRGVYAIHRRIADLMRPNCSEEVLDVGCGSGTLLFLLRKRCGDTIKLYGIDPSEDMIGIAERKNERRNSRIYFRAGIGERLEFEDNKFDWVISSLVFHHLPWDVKRQVAQEIRRVLKPGGHVLITDWGRSRNLLGRIISVTVKKHAFSAENLQGSVLQVLQETGFRPVTVLNTQFGIIEHIVGKKI